MKMFKLIMKDVSKSGLKALACLTAVVLVFVPTLLTSLNQVFIQSETNHWNLFFLVVFLVVILTLAYLVLAVPLRSRRRYFETARAVGISRRGYVIAIIAVYLIISFLISLVSLGMVLSMADKLTITSTATLNNFNLLESVIQIFNVMMQLALVGILHYRLGSSGVVYLGFFILAIGAIHFF